MEVFPIIKTILCSITSNKEIPDDEGIDDGW